MQIQYSRSKVKERIYRKFTRENCNCNNKIDMNTSMMNILQYSIELEQCNIILENFVWMWPAYVTEFETPVVLDDTT